MKRLEKKTSYKLNRAPFMMLGIIIVLMMVVFYFTIALPCCEEVRGAISLTMLPTAGLSVTLLCFYRACNYDAMASEQRRARRHGEKGPSAPMHALEALNVNNEDYVAVA